MKTSGIPKVVSNTTPLISLLKLERLELIKHLYSEIFIPFAVYEEVEAGKNKDFYQDLAKIDWIHIVEVQDIYAVKEFSDLDKGEAEAIVLANELSADLILLDEKMGRFHAIQTGLVVTGTIGILIKAKTNKLIDKLKPLLIELTKKNVWINDKLQKVILNIVGED